MRSGCGRLFRSSDGVRSYAAARTLGVAVTVSLTNRTEQLRISVISSGDVASIASLVSGIQRVTSLLELRMLDVANLFAQSAVGVDNDASLLPATGFSTVPLALWGVHAKDRLQHTLVVAIAAKPMILIGFSIPVEVEAAARS